MTRRGYVGGLKVRSIEIKNGNKALPLLFYEHSTTFYPTAKLVPRQWRFLRGLATEEDRSKLARGLPL